MNFLLRLRAIICSTVHSHPDAWHGIIAVVWSVAVAASLFRALGSGDGGLAAALSAGDGSPAVSAIGHSLLWFAGMAAVLWLRRSRPGRRGPEVPDSAEIMLPCRDLLTNLPNRVLLLDRLNQSLVRSNRNGQQSAVLSIDLDDFRAVNERHGDKVGDAALIEVSCRIATVIRQTDTVARVGGDEFVVVLGELPGPRIAARIANDVLEAIALPISVKGEEISVTASMGIAFFPTDARTPEDLLKRADAAMREVKDLERSGFSFAVDVPEPAPASVA